jgi:hypothetical protein
MSDGLPWAGMRTGTASATSSRIEVGTLVLDMYDPAAKQLVWIGSATKTINLSKDQQKNQRNLDKAMQKLLKTFHPHANNPPLKRLALTAHMRRLGQEKIRDTKHVCILEQVTEDTSVNRYWIR